MNVNFFWKGNDFDKFDVLCIKSHIKVGHNVIMWLSGDTPNSKYWISNDITIKNADDIYNVSEFIENGGNFQTASDLWRFNFLYKYGGWYCDTDAFALKHFPNNKWIVCSAENKKFLSIGVLKVPSKQMLFIDCINNIEKKWGNVKVFSDTYFKYFNNINSTIDDNLFYPWSWQEYDTLLSDIKLKNINSYSIHLYHTMLKRNNIKCEKTAKHSLLNDLIDFVK